MPLHELYGMSECSGPCSVGKPGHNRTGSCGPAVHGLTCKINEPDEEGNGEVLYSTFMDL